MEGTRKQAPVGGNRSELEAKIPAACASEKAAVELMEDLRWGDEEYCPRCGSTNVYKMTKRGSDERNDRYLWRCRDCSDVGDHDQYTVRTGTVMEESKIPLRLWCHAFWRACSSKKGISAKQIERETGLTYKSAWFLMHRIREAMKGAGNGKPKLDGDVEVDETYVGGKPRNPGDSKPGRGTDKEPVMAMVEREGEVRALHITDVTSDTLKGAIREHVHRPSRILSDKHRGYPGIGDEYEGGHETIRHPSSARRWHDDAAWVDGDVHTNTVEGFFSLIKRGVYGVFHSVSPKHLNRYVSEFEFRYNTRDMDDGDRTARAIRGAVGKRLMWASPLG